MKQVFQSNSPSRWKRFKLTFRIIVSLLLIAFSISIISLYIPGLPSLPEISQNINSENKILNPGISQSSHDVLGNKNAPYKTPDNINRYYHFSKNMFENKNSNNNRDIIKTAFYVNWELQSYLSLRDNIDHLNTVMPEWFIINNTGDSISTDIDIKALDLMRSHHVKIIPMLTNFYSGQWNGENVHRIISNEDIRKKIIKSILENLKKYNFQGINIDFEDLVETTDEYVIQFQKELYECLHQNNLLVTQDIPPGNADYNIKELQHYNDYLVIMAYDKHNSTTKAGDIAPLNWVENIMDKLTSEVPPGKVILGLCSYGYDWQENEGAQNTGFDKAMAVAKKHHSEIIYDPASCSVHFKYKDDKGNSHNVYFNDAVSNFNAMRLGYEYNIGGFAAWRLGEEDARLWSFFNKNLCRDSIGDIEQFANNLRNVPTKNNVSYDGSGDVLDVIATPTDGVVSLKTDINDKLIVEERFEKIPCGYEIQKSGMKDKKIVLSFDDGPDLKYTPQIINILEQEKIPASFFLLGLNAQNNIPLVKELFEKGYEIGNHSFTHPNFTNCSKSRIKMELRSTRRLIQSITGCSSILFRPPFNGDDDSELPDDIYPMALSKEEHYYTIASSIDPRDWEKNISADQIVKRVVEGENSGNIVLLHDGGGDRDETIKALPQIIRYYKDKGYTFTTIADLMGKTRNDVMPKESSSFEKIINATNFLFAGSLFYSFKLLSGLFLCAIVLLMFRLLIIAVLASIQKIKNKEIKHVSIYDNEFVSVIVPAYNEETTIVKTVDTLLLSNYENLEIIVVDDGSSDGTFEKLLFHTNGNKRVKLLSKRNGGKASALNFGIQHSSGAIVVCIDADTQLRNDAIGKLMNYFTDDKTAAVAGNVKVGNECNWLTKWQTIECITGQNFDRRAFDLINCITIVPGAIGAFRRDCLLEMGGFSQHTLAEDCDLTMKLLEAGYKVKYSPQALAFTEVPETFKMFLKQRFRWTFGVMQSFWKHRRSFLNPKAGSMGLIAMPNILLFQFIIPAVAPFLDVLMILSIFTGQGMQILFYYVLFIAIEAAGAILAFSFEKERLNRLWLLFPQRIVYRWLISFVLYKAIIKAIRGELISWGNLKRTGKVEMGIIPDAMHLQLSGTELIENPGNPVVLKNSATNNIVLPGKDTDSKNIIRKNSKRFQFHRKNRNHLNEKI